MYTQSAETLRGISFLPLILSVVAQVAKDRSMQFANIKLRYLNSFTRGRYSSSLSEHIVLRPQAFSTPAASRAEGEGFLRS